MKASGGVEVQFQSLLITALDGSVGQLHASAALSPEKDHPYQLNMRQGGFWELSGLFGEEINLSVASRC